MGKLTVGSLFAGIGGFDLGLERAGMEVKWQVEVDPFCQRVLAKHWPQVPRYGDITKVDWSTVEPVDLVCGGFPCQDLSVAGKRAGIDGSRSGLWSEYVRCLRTLRPRYVLVENVPGLLANAAMGRVLRDLASCGYDAEWDCLPACEFGANRERERIFIIANSTHNERVYKSHFGQSSKRLPNDGNYWKSNPWNEANAKLCRMDDGIPDRVDRTAKLGNAVVPQIVEWIGRRIIEAHNDSLSPLRTI